MKTLEQGCRNIENASTACQFSCKWCWRLNGGTFVKHLGISRRPKIDNSIELLLVAIKATCVAETNVRQFLLLHNYIKIERTR
jgi:hypothetical protein